MVAISRRFCTGALLLGLWLAQVCSTFANDELYRKVAPSTAMIQSNVGVGTGWLVDSEERLLVTARHVIAQAGVAETVMVVFAQTKDGDVITDKKHYEKNRATLYQKGKVIYNNNRRDMAIIQVEKLPEGIKPLKLAEKPARPGQAVHVIGQGTDKFGGLFGYSQGYVRNVFNWRGANHVAHQVPTNQGDSGGPVFNDKGEVVGFISVGTIGVPPPKNDPFYAVQVTDLSICVSEIRSGLAERKNLVERKKENKSIFAGKGIEIKLKDGKGSYSGALSDKDEMVNDRYYKIFTVKLEKDKTYRIDYLGDLTDNAKYDAYLFLEDGEGTKLAEDDDSGGGDNGLNSRITQKIDKTGTYRIITTTFVPQQMGKFTLEIVPGDEKEPNEVNLKQQLNNFNNDIRCRRPEVSGQQ